MSELVLDFNEVSRDDLGRVGGKGANLGELTAAGVDVPSGFCITTRAFEEFVASVDEVATLLDEVDDLDPDDIDAVRHCGKRLRDRLEKAQIPAGLHQAIVAAFEDLDDDDRWAVRSSATLEDLPEASFAGQQDTYLNVRGSEQLLDAVRRCWASLFTDRAILYRRRQGYGSLVAKLSVVVQRMVESDVSGILFTADPITGHRKICSIDASYGLGEAVVSGIVDADNFRVDRRTGEVVSERLGGKGVEIVALPDGGTTRREVEPGRQQAPSLSREQIDELAAIAERIEAHYGGTPQDVEWSFERGELKILQSRPITTLFPIPQPQPTDDALHVYVSFGHVQVMTEPMKPLGMDVIRVVMPIGKSTDDPAALNPLLAEAGHRLFMDLTPALRVGPLRRRIPSILTVVDETMSKQVAEVSSRREFTDSTAAGADIGRFVRRYAIPMFFRTLANICWRGQDRVRADAVRVLEQVETDARNALAKSAERYRTAREVIGGALVRFFPHVMPVVIAGMLSAKLLRRRFGDSRVEQLTRGLVGNVTTDMDLELADVADTAREVPELVELLRGEPDGETFEAARQFEAAGEFFARWDRFLERYGHRGPGEIDISRRRWEDDPRSLSKALTGTMADPNLGAHRDKHAALVEAGDRVGEEFVAEAGFGRRWWVRRLVRNVRTYLAMREHPKFYLMRIFSMVRDEFLSYGDELVDRGMLDARDDIWMLHLDEVRAALHDELPNGQELVAERRRARKRHFELRPPRVITSDGEAPQLPPREDLPPGALAGISASTGVVEGRARVVLDPTGEVLHAGEILVAPFSDPGWTPLFIHAAGLVMEVGGLMTHGSVVAREYGIPAVVGVDDATRRIETGQRIRVDGDAGIVEILDDDPPATEEAA